MDQGASIAQFVPFAIGLAAMAWIVALAAWVTDSSGWTGLAVPAVLLLLALIWHLADRRRQGARAARGAPR
jgi:Ni/Fe-hydrogenase subunit HybB-like protein